MKGPTKVVRSRFEIVEDGHVGYLEFETDGHGWMTIWQTEVAPALRGKGIVLELVRTAFEYARESGLRVDVICPLALHVVEGHPEFQALMGKRSR